MFTIDRNEATGLIRCTSSGFLTVAEVQQSSQKVFEAVADMRRKFGSFKMLMMSLDTIVQSPEILKAIHQYKAYATRPGDRVAVVISSILQKGQAKRLFQQEQERVFVSEAEAMAWLMSEGADCEAEGLGDLRRTLAN